MLQEEHCTEKPGRGELPITGPSFIGYKKKRREKRMSEETKKKAPKGGKPLAKMTVKDLKEIALEIPHDHLEIAVSDMNKEQLVAFIKEARGIKEDASEKKAKKAKVIKVALTKQEVKEKIRKLKEEQASALEQKDGDQARVLRRRISRLKKQSRKIV